MRKTPFAVPSAVRALALSLSAAAAFVFVAASLAGPPVPKDPDEKYKVRVAKWDKEAILVRSDKKVDKVAVGASLAVGDRVATGKKTPVDLFCADWGLQRLKPDSVLRYLSYKPSVMKYGTTFELAQELVRGSVLTRIGYLTSESVFHVRGRGKITAPKGTAFSVATEGEKMTLIVAEGEVAMNLESDPDNVVRVAEREKLVVEATMPTEPTPITAADAAVFNELLSLPVSGLGGYQSVRDLTAADVPDLVTLRIDPAVVVLGSAATKYRVTMRPNIVALTARDDFWTVDAAGVRRNIGKGFHFEDVSLDGTKVLASKPNLGLWVMDFDGKTRRQITKRALASATFSPDAARVVAGEGWTPTKPPVSRPTRYWTLASAGTGERPLTDKVPATGWGTPHWVRGGRQLVFERSTSQSVDLIDGDSAPARLIARLDSRYVVSVTPLGKWIILGNPSNGFPNRLIRVSDGVGFDIGNFDSFVPLVGEATFGGAANGALAEFNPATGTATPYTLDERAPPLFSGVAGPTPVSPNGQLIAFGFGGPPRLMVAEAADPSNDYDTYVESRWGRPLAWTAGNRVRFQDWMVTLGVKRRPAWAPPRSRRFTGQDGNRYVRHELAGYDPEPKAINRRGNVAGILKGQGYAPYFWSPDTGLVPILRKGKDLAGMVAESGMAFGLTDGDVVFGRSERRESVLREESKEAWAWHPKEGFAWLGIKGEWPSLEGVLSNGDCVWSTRAEGAKEAVYHRWRDGKWDRTDPDNPIRGTVTVVTFPRDFLPAQGNAISPRGHWVGMAPVPGGFRLATWNGIDIPTVHEEAGPVNEGNRNNLVMNSRGQIAFSRPGQQGNTTALYTPGRGTVQISDSFMVPYSLNNAGQMVGVRFVDDDPKGVTEQEWAGNAPILWDGKKLIELDRQGPAGWKLITAVAINEKGQVAGRARRGNNVFGYALRPKQPK